MLSIIVLGKESIKYANMDTYMAALIEKLQELWRGVITLMFQLKLVNKPLNFEEYSCGLFMIFQLMDL